ncbi:hypothetical protein D3C87_1987980 [compost metagenome]
MVCRRSGATPLSKIFQGFMDMRPLKIQVKVMTANTSPNTWCQRIMKPRYGVRDPVL